MRVLHFVLPDLAKRETRSVTILGDEEIPDGMYHLFESYCDERGCDCRRVMFSVVSERTHEIAATVSHAIEVMPGWATDEMDRAYLDPLNPQSDIAEALLGQVEAILRDEEYEARLLRHYCEFKTALGDTVPEIAPGITVRRAAPKVGANDPCPCGSGKKYKRCCRT